jgi:putative CocE/NonD family hydrolase
VTGILVERDLPVRLCDGTVLTTDVYRPVDGGPHPVLLQRTPYGKSNAGFVGGLFINPLDAVQHGYAVVVQDVRGRFGSTGDFVPFVHERADGADTITWCVDQHWCDGTVGLFGSSYMGVTALQALLSGHEAIAAGALYLTAADYHDGWVYSGGALELAFSLRWSFSMVEQQLARSDVDPAKRGRILATLHAFFSDQRAFLEQERTPEQLFGEAAEVLPHWAQWLDNPQYNSYWAGLDATRHVDRINAPVRTIAAWYDGFLRGGLDLCRALGPSTRNPLVIGPWDHASYMTNRPTCAGERNFGPTARPGTAGLQTSTLAWFDQWMRDADPTDEPAVRYFLMPSAGWRTAPAWPPAGRQVSWSLGSDGQAQLPDRGTLTPTPGGDVPDSFVYDPRNPVPTYGGRHLGYEAVPAGVQDQTRIQTRLDVLTYTTPVLEQDVQVAGPMKAELHVMSTAPATDFTVKLVDVDPSGPSWLVADAITRAQFDPSDATKITIDLLDTAYVFSRGHRLRLEISSSNYPRFDRSLNGSDGDVRQAPPARQTIFHAPQRPSTLVLWTTDGEGLDT